MRMTVMLSDQGGHHVRSFEERNAVVFCPGTRIGHRKRKVAIRLKHLGSDDHRGRARKSSKANSEFGVTLDAETPLCFPANRDVPRGTEFFAKPFHRCFTRLTCCHARLPTQRSAAP